MDRGSWWATVHGVAKSRTRLKRLSSSSSSSSSPIYTHRQIQILSFWRAFTHKGHILEWFHENSLNCELSQCGALIWEAVYAGDVDLCCVSCTRAVSLPQDLDDESFLFYLPIPANHQIVCSCIHYCINNTVV